MKCICREAVGELKLQHDVRMLTEKEMESFKLLKVWED